MPTQRSRRLALFPLLMMSLMMSSADPPRYRYSPERLKKALSCQSDEFPHDGRQGRRQSGKQTRLQREHFLFWFVGYFLLISSSEPSKQMMKSSRGKDIFSAGHVLVVMVTV